MPKTPSAIPVGTQFSPAVIDLKAFLAAIVAHSGDKAAMEAAVWAAPVRTSPPAKPPTARRASLPLEAAVQYGLLTPRTYEATDLAKRLNGLAGTDLADAFGRHILLELGGLRVVEAVQQMNLDSLTVTGDSLARYLTDQGFTVTEHNTAINSLRMWLAEAGVFGKTSREHWTVDPVRKRELAGLDDEQIAALVALNPDQRAFAIALARIAPPGDYPAADVRVMAEAIAGHRLDRSNLPKTFLEPLKLAGLIDFDTKGTAGGKSATLRTLPAFDKWVLMPFLERSVKSLDAALTAYYKKAPATIYAELDSADTGIKGQALEAFAIHVMRLLGLRFLYWRKRAPETTGRAEVDVVMSGVIGGLPTRWQVQCKNTPTTTVSLEDVAKEVGLLPLTKASHLAIFANCPFTNDARRYAAEVMRHSSVVIFLLDRADFERIKTNPGLLPAILRAKAEEVAALNPVPTLWTV